MRRERAPRDRVAVEQIPRPRREEEDRGRALRPRPPASSPEPRGTRRRDRRRTASACERTRTIAPFAAAPSRSKSAFVPMPASTSGAVIGPGVDGARPNETTESGNATGATSEADAETGSHFKRHRVRLELDRIDARAPERRRCPTAATARSPALPVTRPPMSSVSRRRSASMREEGPVSFSIAAPAGSCDDARPRPPTDQDDGRGDARRPRLHDGSFAAEASGGAAAGGVGRARGARRRRRKGRPLRRLVGERVAAEVALDLRAREGPPAARRRTPCRTSRRPSDVASPSFLLPLPATLPPPTTAFASRETP